MKRPATVGSMIRWLPWRLRSRHSVVTHPSCTPISASFFNPYYYPINALDNHRHTSSFIQSYINELTSGMTPETQALCRGITQKDRRSLSRVITMMESSRIEHRQQAHALMANLLLYNSNANANSSNIKTKGNRGYANRGHSLRIGITGPPGVGKSTFIEALGQRLTSEHYSVNLANQMLPSLAVLAVDPSSVLTGGSILGDKTRMQNLMQDPSVYIRPSPSRGFLGGVARTTAETMELMEAAGYSCTIVETVGVGQSEIAVASLTDLFVMLAPPSGGDDLQGIKRGIMEQVDIVVVNKNDGDTAAAACRSVGSFKHALRLVHPKSPHWACQVTRCSALTGDGMNNVMDLIHQFYDKFAGDMLAKKRASQRISWLYSESDMLLRSVVWENQRVKEFLRMAEADVTAGITSPFLAADALFKHILTAKIFHA